MTFEAPIANCVDCDKPLPLSLFFDNRMRCPECNRKFSAMSKEERDKANREIEERYKEEG